MAIPGFQQLMRPTLHTLADGAVWLISDLRSALATELSIPAVEVEERLPSGARRWDNRVHWSIVYLNQAQAIARVGRSQVQITNRGRELLTSGPEVIKIKTLRQYTEFQEFMQRTQQSRAGSADVEESASEIDPTELIFQSVTAVRESVAAQVLERLKSQSPEFLERMILDLMQKMGYGSPEHLGRSGDEGFDGVIHQDTLGLERVYLQAKRYTENAVGRPAVQAFAGAIQGAKAARGVLVTTSRFSQDAREFAESLPSRVVLIDGLRLSQLMVDYRIGVEVKECFEMVEVDNDYFED